MQGHTLTTSNGRDQTLHGRRRLTHAHQTGSSTEKPAGLLHPARPTASHPTPHRPTSNGLAIPSPSNPQGQPDQRVALHSNLDAWLRVGVPVPARAVRQPRPHHPPPPRRDPRRHPASASTTAACKDSTAASGSSVTRSFGFHSATPSPPSSTSAAPASPSPSSDDFHPQTEAPFVRLGAWGRGGGA